MKKYRTLPSPAATPSDMISIALKKHGIVFSKSQAAKLVGGEARLLYLIETGVIGVEKPTNKQNGKWFCNAGDVVSYIQLIKTKPPRARERMIIT